MDTPAPAHRGLSGASEAQRATALENFRLIRPFLEEEIPLTHIAAASGRSLRTLRRWVRRYRTQGLGGLLRATRKDQGRRRALSPTLQRAIEGLALQKPRRTVASIHREAERICRERGWPSPSSSTVAR